MKEERQQRQQELEQAAAASDSGESMEEAESVEAAAKEVEPVVVPEGVIAEELAGYTTCLPRLFWIK